MKLKYYLRGMGVGVLLTAIIMGVALGGSGSKMSDAEVIKRARQLGMVEAESTRLSDYSESVGQSEVKVENDESAPDQKVDEEGKEISEEVNQGESETGESASSMDETSQESEEVGENSESIETEPDIALSSSSSEEKASTDTVRAEVDNNTSAETETAVSENEQVNGEDAQTALDSTTENSEPVENTSADNTVAENENVSNASAENTPAEDTNVVNDNAQPADVNYVVVVIPGGSDSDTCARIIREAGLIEDGIGFNKYLETQGLDRYIRSGTKQIPRGASFEEIARIITR